MGGMGRISSDSRTGTAEGDVNAGEDMTKSGAMGWKIWTFAFLWSTMAVLNTMVPASAFCFCFLYIKFSLALLISSS